MKFIKIIFKSIFAELIIGFLLLFALNNYIGQEDETIKADAIGYYDYLPSLFIHKDLIRKNTPFATNQKLYERIDIRGNYNDYNGYKVNKYPIGPAVLQLPFFLFTYNVTHFSGSYDDGYQVEFHKTVYYAAIFYLIFGLYFLKKLLLLYDINRVNIFITQLLITLGTNITIYSNFDAGYSHIYSFFAITAFCFFMKHYFYSGFHIKHFLWACALLGLIVLLRQVNIIVILMIPFLAGSFNNFKIGVSTIFKNFKALSIGFLIFSSIVFIQLIVWHLQTGSFIVYSYQGEGFNFLKPEFINVLFSYKKGFFVYTPLMFCFSIFAFILILKKHYYLAITWFGFFFILTFVFSSWWIWSYGASFGMRPYIDYYGVFALPFLIVFNDLRLYLKIIITTFLLLFIPLNIIQSIQYKEYIIHWTDMNKTKYWVSFLHLEPQYKGYIWTEHRNNEGFELISEYALNNLKVGAEKLNFEFDLSKIIDIKDIKKIRISFQNDFSSDLDTEVTLMMKGPNKNDTYWAKNYLFHYSQTPNKKQTGVYDYFINNPNMPVFDRLEVEFSESELKTTLKNVKIQLYK